MSINVTLNLIDLTFCIICATTVEGLGECNVKGASVGFTTMKNASFTLQGCLFLLYALLICAYIYLFIRLRKYFIEAYPEIYELIKCKLFVFIIVLEIFLIIRCFFYFLILYQTLDPEDHLMKTSFYCSEIFIIILIQVIQVKNSYEEKSNRNS